MQVSAGDRVDRLSWLWPNAQSLSALARPGSDAWEQLKFDPSVLLLLLREPHIARLPDAALAVHPLRFQDPRFLDSVASRVQSVDGHWVDWRQPALRPLYRSAVALALLSSLIAERGECGDPRTAWAAGLLAPLGLLAIAAVDPNLISACLSHPRFSHAAADVHYAVFGSDHRSLARRVAVRWGLPGWLVSPDDSPLGAAVRLAEGMSERLGFGLGLSRPEEFARALARLGFSLADLGEVETRFRAYDLDEAFEREADDPRQSPAVWRDLEAARDRQREAFGPFLQLLDADCEALHASIELSHADEEDRLNRAKLEALAEFAAGASHEINNPLAVIAGQGQYLLQRQPDDRQRSALHSIVRQARRINAILSELMHFARPPRPSVQRLTLGDVVRKVVEEFRPQADEAGVALEFNQPAEAVYVDGDLKQLQTATACLVRNAVEAASLTQGSVVIAIRQTPGAAEVVVEDSGPGLTPEQRQHMFDPFYSGRSAGRGRGLGLPTAWRLARENGGDVSYRPAPDRTCFALTLPIARQSERLAS